MIHHHFLSPFSRQEWHENIRTMLAVAQVDGDVELILGRDGDIAALNDSRMGCVGPTNILSFPSGAFSDMPCGEMIDWENPETRINTSPTLGTLFLSVDTLRRECRLYGQDREIHAKRLLAHGLAHLLGYNHGPEMDELCEAMLGDAS